MTAVQLNAKLERGLFGGVDCRNFGATPGFGSLQVPSDPLFATGVADSVTEQANRIDAAWDAVNHKITLSLNPAGPGYFIPYIGNGVRNPVGVAQTVSGVGVLGRGLATYTPVIVGGGGIEWVVTGPFTGCHAVDFTAAGGKVFAHVITPATGYSADTLPNQIANICAQTGAPAPNATHDIAVSGAGGEGYVFWTFLAGSWYRRIVWVLFGAVASAEAKVQL